jgi:hypothetical protein
VENSKIEAEYVDAIFNSVTADGSHDKSRAEFRARGEFGKDLDLDVEVERSRGSQRKNLVESREIGAGGGIVRED